MQVNAISGNDIWKFPERHASCACMQTKVTHDTYYADKAKPGLLKRLIEKIDNALKSKADATAREGSCCCGGADVKGKGKGGSCC